MMFNHNPVFDETEMDTLYRRLDQPLPSGYPPIVNSQTVARINATSSNNVELSGDFFTPDTVVTSLNGTVSNFNFSLQSSCQFDYTSDVEGEDTITITTPSGSVDINIIVNPPSSWVDMRAGRDTFTEEHNAGLTVSRDTNGAYVNGSLWSSWYRINSHSWNRSSKKKVSIIGKASQSHMIGITSERQSLTSSSQYYQAEVVAYMSGNTLSGFYGKSAGGGGVNGGTSLSLSGNPYYKLVFEDNGEANSTYSLYGLSDLSNFDDESILLGTNTIPAHMNGDGENLMVDVISTSTHRFIAFNIEDM
jgi:hypothetical protein